MTLAIVDSSSGAASASSMKRSTSPRSRAGTSIPPTISGRSTSRYWNRVDDAEVAAAAADRPEQVRVRVRVRAEDLPVGGHDVGGEEVVDRQAVLPHQVADAAAGRDPADPDRAGVAEPDREPVLGRGLW